MPLIGNTNMGVSQQTLNEFVALVRNHPGHTVAEYARVMGLTSGYVNMIVLHSESAHELLREGLIAPNSQGRTPQWLNVPGAVAGMKSYKPMTRADYFASCESMRNPPPVVAVVEKNWFQRGLEKILA